MMKVVMLTAALICLSLSATIGFAKDGGCPGGNNSTGANSTHNSPATTTGVAAKDKNNGNTGSGKTY